MKMKIICAAMSWLLLGAPAVMAAERADISGVYHCKGRTHEGKTYEGRTTIKKAGEAYQLLWSFDTKTHYGVALREGNLLSSSWQADDQPGVPGIVVYRIQPGGVLKGKFASYPGGRMEEETLTYQGSAD